MIINNIDRVDRAAALSCTLVIDDHRVESDLLDALYLESLPVLNIVCTGTHHRAASFLENMSSKHVWN